MFETLTQFLQWWLFCGAFLTLESVIWTSICFALVPSKRDWLQQAYIGVGGVECLLKMILFPPWSLYVFVMSTPSGMGDPLSWLFMRIQIQGMPLRFQSDLQACLNKGSLRPKITLISEEGNETLPLYAIFEMDNSADEKHWYLVYLTFGTWPTGLRYVPIFHTLGLEAAQAWIAKNSVTWEQIKDSPFGKEYFDKAWNGLDND